MFLPPRPVHAVISDRGLVLNAHGHTRGMGGVGSAS